MATPSMLGPPGWIDEVDLLLLEVAEVLGRDLADLVVAGEPAELQVDGLGLGLGEAARGQEACGGEAGRRQLPLEQRTTSGLPTELAHGDFDPSSTGNAIDLGVLSKRTLIRAVRCRFGSAARAGGESHARRGLALFRPRRPARLDPQGGRRALASPPRPSTGRSCGSRTRSGVPLFERGRVGRAADGGGRAAVAPRARDPERVPAHAGRDRQHGRHGERATSASSRSSRCWSGSCPRSSRRCRGAIPGSRSPCSSVHPSEIAEALRSGDNDFGVLFVDDPPSRRRGGGRVPDLGRRADAARSSAGRRQVADPHRVRRPSRGHAERPLAARLHHGDGVRRERAPASRRASSPTRSSSCAR